MIEIPEDVEQWTYGKIVDLVNEGYNENDILEIKREINSDSERLTKSVCAFANTNGGTIIFGIDNDRKKPLHLNERIIGLDDSDQLKRNIIDKIKNIHPNIPIKKIIFRKTNITLPNKKVIVILKILQSDNRPHQYNHIFYKRLSDGNEPMEVNEVKQNILESQKQRHNEVLLILELGLLKDSLINSKQRFVSGKNGLGYLSYLDLTSTIHFQHNLAYAYSVELPSTLVTLIHNVSRLSSIPEAYIRVINGQIDSEITSEAKNDGYDDPKKYVNDLILTRINLVLKNIETVSELLHLDIPNVDKMKPEKYSK